MLRIISWFRNFNRHLVDNCRFWYKKWSTWLAGVFGVIVTFLWNEPTIFQEITGVLPPEIRAKLSPVIFALVAGLPILVAHLKQNNLRSK